MLHFLRAAVALQVKIPASTLERHVPASAYIVGKQLAEYIDDYVRENHLGYFPAIDYFQRTDDNIDADLITTAEGIAWFSANLVREELRTKLRAIFSNIRFESIQNIAFTMPMVRPGQSNYLHKLITHYTPDHVKVVMTVSVIKKQMNTDNLDSFIRSALKRWLGESFASMEISSVSMLDTAS